MLDDDGIMPRFWPSPVWPVVLQLTRANLHTVVDQEVFQLADIDNLFVKHRSRQRAVDVCLLRLRGNAPWFLRRRRRSAAPYTHRAPSSAAPVVAVTHAVLIHHIQYDLASAQLLHFLYPVQRFPLGNAGARFVAGILIHVILAAGFIKPVSMPTTIHCTPKRSASRVISVGSASAGELMEILSAPNCRMRAASSGVLMPRRRRTEYRSLPPRGIPSFYLPRGRRKRR